MATPPTFVQEAETAFNSSTTPKSTTAFNDLVADILVSLGVAENGDATAIVPTLSGETFTSQDSLGTTNASCRVDARTAAIASAGTSESVSEARSGVTEFFGANVLTFRGSDGVGQHAAAKIDTGSGAPSVSITTLQDNSAIAMIVGDFSAVDGATRAYLSVNGSGPTEQTYFRSSANYTLYVAWYADAGAAGAKTVGLSTPSTMRYTIAAIEIKGAAGAGGSLIYDERAMRRHLRRR